jgi:hypothetical protein
MMFDAPQPWSVILRLLADKVALPTNQSSDQLTALTRDIRKMSLYSARTTSAAYLEEVREQLQLLAEGKINLATARQNLQLWLDQVGYNPETHFGDDATIPAADENSLRDLSSDKRIKLMLETNMRLAANTAYMTAGSEPDNLAAFPCWELVRIYWRRVPRGTTEHDLDLGWPERWVRSGGRLYDGRMIARKDDPIWQNLGDSGVFRDGTDSAAPPYAYNSGMGIEDVARQECIALGVIHADTQIGSTPPSLLGDFFDGHPERATLASLKSSRADILAALQEIKEAA